jgi:hypothetical protein
MDNAPKDLGGDFSPEPLHPDLDGYFSGEGFCTFIHHPLIIQLYAESLHKMINAAYLQKKKAVAEATEESQWYSYVFLHERPYRLNAFHKIKDRLDDATFWELVRNIWTDSENIRQNITSWRTLFSSRPAMPDLLMADEDYTYYSDRIPEKVQVFRGQVEGPYGISWTLDKERASWFAKRHALFSGGLKTEVLSATVLKRDILAYFNCRFESEVVVLNPSKLQKVSPPFTQNP